MKFGIIIREWYKKNVRELPMRQTRDPYKIWISEIVLQQTRMNQGLPYYLSFIETFPDVASLARASEDEVLLKWQGLGYYNRARNLQWSARYIMEQLGGTIPGDFQGLLKLKGVGRYTAAAIASFCYNEAVAAVDGNVARVIARLYGVEDPVNSTSGSRQIEALAQELLDADDPGNHNQAMIDFGALQCTPSSPKCNTCPLSDSCFAYLRGKVDLIPLKNPGRKAQLRWFYFYIISHKDRVILTKRGDQDIWKSLYQFPVRESLSPVSEEELLGHLMSNSAFGGLSARVIKTSLSATIPHQLSHRTIQARFIHAEVSSLPSKLPEGWLLVEHKNLDSYPVPRLIQRYLESFKF